MAVGRQDYQAGVVPIKSGYSLAQTTYWDYDGDTIASEDDGYMCEYTPGAGYQLNICGYRVIGQWPYMQALWVHVAAEVVMVREFDFEIQDNFPEGAMLVIQAGQLFRLQVHNRDEITQTFTALVMGYLEQIES